MVLEQVLLQVSVRTVHQTIGTMELSLHAKLASQIRTLSVVIICLDLLANGSSLR